jgi:hypothetical protein
MSQFDGLFILIHHCTFWADFTNLAGYFWGQLLVSGLLNGKLLGRPDFWAISSSSGVSFGFQLGE